MKPTFTAEAPRPRRSLLRLALRTTRLLITAAALAAAMILSV